MVFLAPAPAMSDCAGDHQIGLDHGAGAGLADASGRLSKAGATPGGGCVGSLRVGKVQKGAVDSRRSIRSLRSRNFNNFSVIGAVHTLDRLIR